MENENCRFETRFPILQDRSSVGYTHVLCCPCCMYITLSFANLHKHALVHEAHSLSSYRTYTCSNCFSTSTEKYLMLEHLNIYHKNTNKPAELTEEIHRILRKSEMKEEKSLFVGSKKHWTTLSKTDSKRRTYWQTLRTLSKIQNRIKIKSRLNKLGLVNGRKSFKDLLSQKLEEKKSLENRSKIETEYSIPNENEPIDMTIKNTKTLIDNSINEKDLKTSESNFLQDYPSSYQNIRTYLYDVLAKNSLSTGALSQSPMFRYLTAQFQSLQAAKYLNSNGFINQATLLKHPETNFNHRIYDSPVQISGTKIQDNNSINQRNLHRNNFSPFQNHILLEWYDNHKQKPYPSTEETKHLAALCGLSYPQVKKWFANKRARSSFYQKDDVMSCQNHSRYNLLRFPMQISNRLKADVVKTLETQFANSIDNLTMISSSCRKEDSIVSP